MLLSNSGCIMSGSIPPDNRFHTTNWTQVVASRGNSPAAQQALRELSVVYYAPVEFFLKRYRNSDEACDLTQSFFAKLLEGESLQHVEKAQGRFRSYLLSAVKHFLADHDDRLRASKRGGGRTILSILNASTIAASSDVDHAFDVVDPQAFPPDAYFDRQWAAALVERSIDTLREQLAVTGDATRFESLKTWIVTTATHEQAAEVADSLGMTVGAFNVAIHRLRKRFRQVVKALIAETVSDDSEIQDELHHLIRALAYQST